LNGKPVRATQNPREESPNGKKDEKKDGEVEEDTGETEEIRGGDHSPRESGDGVGKRYPTRERKAPGEWYRANMAADGKETEPQTYEEALAGPDAELWRMAMDEKFALLLENGLWELEKLPDGFKALPMKWVYKIKRDANGNIERYKARLVAKGYLQKQGVDFEEVYAPVSKYTTLRALLAVVAARDMELHQLDVKTVFLNGELKEEIYMHQAQGYEEGGPRMVCHLKKTLYGLMQALRAWHTRLATLANIVVSAPSSALHTDLVWPLLPQFLHSIFRNLHSAFMWLNLPEP
jgi:hypothetical protein